MTVLDTAQSLIDDEFRGTGLERDVKSLRTWLRDNLIAQDGERAHELERIASAAAQREQERSAFREKLLGSLER
jgi:hypothetical protein